MSGRKPHSQKVDQKYSCIFEKGVDKEGNKYSIPYCLLKELGRGGFAKCYSTRLLGKDDKFAVKIFEKHNDRSHNIAKIQNQIEILSSLDHQGIVKYIKKFESLTEIYMIMELCPKGSLDQVMMKREYLTEPEVRCIIAQIVPVLQYLKTQSIIHRDIKMGNIFFNQDYKVKIGDFGLSTHVNNALMKKNVCGTPNYIAPEIINKQEYGCEVDIWSLGILAYTLLIGRPPFEGKSVKNTYSRILKCDLDLNSKDIHISNVAKSFLNRLIVPDRKKRIKLQEILNHPFMSKFNIPKRLQTNFGEFFPSLSFFQKYNKQKQISLSQESKSISSASNGLSPFSSNKKQKTYQRMARKSSYEINALSFLSDQQITAYRGMARRTPIEDCYKQEINLLETSSICNSQEAQEQNPLKRKLPESNLKDQNGGDMKKFIKNSEKKIETREGTKKRLDNEECQKWFLKICKQTKFFNHSQIKNLFSLQDSLESTQLSVFDSFSRIINYIKNTETNTITYLTNHYLMGIIFPEKTSIIYHLRYKKTFYITKKEGFFSAVELQRQLKPEQCQEQLKKQIILFLNEHKIIQGALKTVPKVKSELMREELDFYLSFSFVQDVIIDEKMIAFKTTNGDFTVLDEKDCIFVMSTQKKKVVSFSKGEIKSISSVQNLPQEFTNKLKLSCSMILEMIERDQEVKEQIVEKIDNKDRLFFRITINRKMKANDVI